MKSSVMPVTFMNKSGFRLFGMLHSPSDKPRDIGIIILCPGIKNRIAPHRLYIKMARHLCQLGFQVLRFDPEGIGDSEGEVDEKFAADFYGTVQVGRFVEDTIYAMDWMEQESDISRFILTGLCGGAITGLLTGAKDQRVEALLGLGIPVILDSSNIDHSKYITEGQLKGLREGYLKKILSPRAWIRFLLLKSDYRIIFKSLWQLFGLKSNNQEVNGDSEGISPEKPLAQNNGNSNPYFPLAFREMVSERKVLLIFSEADRLYWEFEGKFMRPYGEWAKKHEKDFEIHIVKNANHIFSFSEWQKDMFAVSSSWLEKHFAQSV